MLVYGAGGHAKVIIDCLTVQQVKVTGVFDDFSKEKYLLTHRIVGGYTTELYMEAPLVLAIGDNATRKELTDKVRHAYGKVIHPSALISDTVKVGEGTAVFHHAVVQSSCTIGRHVIINTSAVIDHDSTVGDFAHISPNATVCGGAVVNEGAHIGANATILPGVSIGKWAVIGAGAIIVENIPDRAVVVGNLGKIVKFTE